jgi:potassium efflux system protein
MLGRRKAGLINNRIYYKIFLTIFVVIFFITASAAYCAQSRQNSDSNTPVVQDANSVIPAVPDTVDTDIAADFTVEQLQKKKKNISESKELNDEIKSKISEVYDQAITRLQQAIDFEGNKQTYSSGRKNAPADLEKVKEQLARQTAFIAPDVPTDITLTEAEQRLTESTLALEQARKNAAYWENEPKRRADRRAQIPEETNTAKQKFDEIQNKIASAKVEAKSSESAQASLDLLAVQKRALEAQIEANTQELLFYDARKEILSTQRDLASRQLTSAQKRAEFWQQKVNELRQKQAEIAQKEAKQAKKQISTSSHPLILDIIESNVELAAEQAKLVKEIEKTLQYSNRIDEQLTSIRKDFQDVQDAVEFAGNKVTDVMGVLLLTKRSNLPSLQQNRQRIKSRLTEI